MSNLVGAYTGYNPQTQKPDTLHHLQERYGAQLEQMTYEQKIVFRAALTGYVAQKPVWKEEGSSITCIECCTESAGADWNIWDEDEELCQHIEACCKLHESDIEGLIEVVTSQIRSRVYISRVS